MGHSKKKPKISNEPQNIINTTHIEKVNQKLIISYEHLDLNNKKYSMDSITDNREKINYYNDYLKKIKEYSELENFKKDIKGRYADRNHIHPIDWNDTRIREKSFTNLDSMLMEQIKGDCWQLGINNHSFRIHGFFISNVFYVVWLDPNHELYRRK